MICDICAKDVMRLSYTWDDPKGKCRDCYRGRSLDSLAPGIITDSIPGGLEIKHGICNPDGTPRKYYEKSAIRAAAFDAGFTISGETPKLNNRLLDARRESERTRETR